MENVPKMYDVAILDSGLSSSVLGAILAKNGLRVVMIDKGMHPRFTVGESTIPETSLQWAIIGDRYDVPEVRALGSAHAMNKIIKTNGTKTNFGFVHHEEGQEARLSEMNQTGPLTELHLFRQDVDAYMCQVALSYGCEAILNAGGCSVEIDAKCATVTLANGKTVSARCVIDGGGHSSILATKYGLREEPTRARTHSRAIFTHMLGVEPYDKYVSGLGPKKDLPPQQFHQGTLHHVVDGGWLWVIPMDNHPGSTNKVCSVGLTLDPRKHPDPGVSPELEFQRFIAKYPDIERQFVNAVATRPWTKTGRLQYSSTRCTGDRYCLLSHGTGFIDALFSRGLANTSRVINLLARTLLDAARDDDFSAARFEELEQYQQALIDENDKLVHGAFVSFGNYGLWNAWLRVWMIYAFTNFSGVFNRYATYLETRDRQDLWRAGASPELGFRDERAETFLTRAHGYLDQVERGELSAEAAEAALYNTIREVDFVLPIFPFADPNVHFQRMSLKTLAQMFQYTRNASDEFRRKYMARGFFSQLSKMQRFREHDGPSLARAALAQRLSVLSSRI